MKLKTVLTCILALYLTAVPVLTQQIDDEYLAKAVFFEKFSKFIRWPEDSGINDKSEPFIVGTIGTNPFGKILEVVYVEHKKSIHNKRVEVIYLKPGELDKISGCHILFISSSCQQILPDILAITKDKPVLTIADTEGYAEKGVLINFYITQRRIRFEINAELFHNTPLKVDTRLLRMAKIVEDP